MSAAGQINAGGRIFATAIRGVAPLAAFKAGDENRITNTTPSNDSALFLPNLQASAQYFVVCFLDYEGNTAGSGDLLWTWSVPSGATMRYTAPYLSAVASPTVQVGVTKKDTDTVTAATTGTGTLMAVTMTGTLQMSATAGTLQLKWAQAHSSATPTIMHAQSSIVAWQVG